LEEREKARLLSAVDLLESLSWEEVERLGRSLPEMSLNGGQVLFTPAHQGRVIFLLLRGRVRLYRVAGGREITLGVVGTGEMFGEAALTAGRRHGAYAQAAEPSEVALMSRETFRRLVHDRPEVGVKATELLSKRLSFCEDRMADIGLKEVPARLAALVLYLCESEGVVTSEGYKIPVRYTHEQLGAMIGSKRVAATRAVTKLKEAGALELKRRYIYLRDVEALKLIAGVEYGGRG
jgi:CRP/FNR family transcriptional regulator, cyclic AMP receptor protein